MVFVEQPVGVGFSQATDPDIAYGDHQAAVDNHDFLKGFYDIFPALKSKPLYLTSESYGGHYLPTLAQEIVKQADLPNFKGFAVGNPLTYMPYRDYGQWGRIPHSLSLSHTHTLSLALYMYQSNLNKPETCLKHA